MRQHGHAGNDAVWIFDSEKSLADRKTGCEEHWQYPIYIFDFVRSLAEQANVCRRVGQLTPFVLILDSEKSLVAVYRAPPFHTNL